MKRKKIGITGAMGNIGTTLQYGLSSAFELVLFDLVRPTAAQGRFVQADLAEKDEVQGILQGLDALIHLAGDPSPAAPPSSTYRNNFLATSIIFEEARRVGVPKIVFASSNFYHQGSITEALRGRLSGKIKLATPPTPQCPYGESKVYGENLGRHLSYFGTQFVALRIGWTVPEDNPALYGGDYMRAVFCSKRDLVSAFTRALEIETGFLAAFAVSDNTRGVFDLKETRERLGYSPQDNAEAYR